MYKKKICELMSKGQMATLKLLKPRAWRQQHSNQQDKWLEAKVCFVQISSIIEILQGWYDVTLVPNVCVNIVEKKIP